MNYLKKNEIGQLLKIKSAIEEKFSFNQILQVCDELKKDLDDPLFSYSYAGCLLANHNRAEDAIKMFAFNLEDSFSSILHNYLLEIGEFVMVSKVFKSAKPYHIYTSTPLYQTHEAAVVENIGIFTQNNPPPVSDRTVTILDIGPGDGELTAQYVNKILELYPIEKVRLIFVDPFEQELKAAAQNCKDKIKTSSEVISICSKIQDIDQEQIHQIMQAKPIWFINAALSVHHMPREQKIPMLKQMKEFSSNFILAEVNWNHDLPEKDSPELIYSVVKNFGFFCEGILSLPISEEDRKLCLYHFPVDEAINIIKQERPGRIDYHTPIEEWQKIANEAGFNVNEPKPTYLLNGDPFLFTMEFFHA